MQGQMYLRGKDAIPLVSQFWANNKYKDHWFRIHRVQKVGFSVPDHYL